MREEGSEGEGEDRRIGAGDWGEKKSSKPLMARLDFSKL